MTTKENHLYEADAIRTFAVIVVLFFHAYGMMYAPAYFPETIDLYREIYYNFNSICLWFHMPLFIFISGGVFTYLTESKGKYKLYWPFVWGKFKRLIIPYLIFSTIFMLSVNNWSWLALLKGKGFTHLWFLPMLFHCFVIAGILIRISFMQTFWAKSFFLLLSFTSMLYFVCPFELFKIDSLFRWFFWFYLGFLIYSSRNTFYDWMKQRFWVVCMLPVVYIASMWYLINFEDNYELRFIEQMGYLSFVLWIWYIIMRAIDTFGTNWVKCKVIQELSACSFGIYIFHYWIQPFMISRTAKSLLPLADWAANHTILFPIIFALLSLLVSYIMTKICLMTKIGRSLIG